MATANRSTSTSAQWQAMPLRPVKKAYEQVADQIRDLIIVGELAPDERLPTEASLAAEFGVSRATVREALRVLSTQNLIRTTQGSLGGSYVTIPSVEHIASSLGTNINLLSHSADVGLEEFLELREFLEVPAARLAAGRGDEETLERLRGAIPDEPLALRIGEQFAHNRDFHSLLVHASGNTLLRIAAEPIFTVLQTHLQRSTLGTDFHTCVNEDHLEILAAVEQRDPEGAASAMQEHLEYLRPMYERAWRHRQRRPR
jgi:DNA-binding FadR family transcriptional regulator